ncbi:MAG: D-isomer specific 2-hydroxyacid dehydrogenase family protein [Actinomycetota bacterium]|nr:D-isomer specific 2-hydroxyacid dehydrogenase family protein [Actinomycetota bacterium]
MKRAGVAIEPAASPDLRDAVERGGGHVVDVGVADALVWVDPADPHGLKELLRACPARWVQLPFAGIESFFAAGAIDTSRTWTCAKGIYGHSTAEHALALMLMAARRLNVHVSATSWTSPRGVGSGFGAAERRLANCTVVIVGTGGIGTALATMLQPLRARVIGVNRSGRPLAGAERSVRIESLGSVLPEADFVVLAAALTPETAGFIGPAELEAMKESAWLVNVARGALVHTDALVEALRSGEIAGAALDVTDPEPLPDGHPLWTLPNAVVTPHVANTWDMALPELTALVERNVVRFASGEELEGLVDPAAGY